MEVPVHSDNPPTDLQNQVMLLLMWRRRAIKANTAHFMSSNVCARWNTILTVFNLISGIAVLFFSNNRFFSDGNFELYGHLVSVSSDALTSVAGLLVVLTTAIQYTLKLETKLRDTKNAGVDFTTIKREIEMLLVSGDPTIKGVEAIQRSHSHSSNNHALVPPKIWAASVRRSQVAINEDADFEKNIIRRYQLTGMFDPDSQIHP